MEHKIFTLRKLEAGGHEVLDEDRKPIGIITHKHLMEHMRQYQEGFEKIPGVTLSDQRLGVDQKVNAIVKSHMQETGASVGVATAHVLNTQKSLADRYNRAHQKEAEA
ncbi:MAG: hypothetical protein ACRD19_17325 [Terriglobia bacterium]